MEETVVLTPVVVDEPHHVDPDDLEFSPFMGRVLWSPESYDQPYEIVIEYLRQFEVNVLGPEHAERFINCELYFVLPSGSQGQYNGLRVYLDSICILESRNPFGSICFLADPIE